MRIVPFLFLKAAVGVLRFGVQRQAAVHAVDRHGDTADRQHAASAARDLDQRQLDSSQSC